AASSFGARYAVPTIGESTAPGCDAASAGAAGGAAGAGAGAGAAAAGGGRAGEGAGAECTTCVCAGGCCAITKVRAKRRRNSPYSTSISVRPVSSSTLARSRTSSASTPLCDFFAFGARNCGTRAGFLFATERLGFLLTRFDLHSPARQPPRWPVNTMSPQSRRWRPLRLVPLTTRTVYHHAPL